MLPPKMTIQNVFLLAPALNLLMSICMQKLH